MPVKDWKSVFEVYVRDPDNALILAQLLATIKRQITKGRGKKGRRQASAELDAAIRALYPYTTFTKVNRRLYRAWIRDGLSIKQETRLREMGVDI